MAMVIGLAIAVGSYSPAEGSGNGELDTEKVPSEYRNWVLAAGRLCEAVSPPLIAAQIDAESNWNSQARSSVGALGLSQFMPGTWATWGVDANGNGKADPFEPGDAIMTQARYDCQLAKDVAGVASDPTQNMLAAYNAGPGAVIHYGGVPPYPETQAYVSKILRLMADYSDVEESGSGSGIGARVVDEAEKWLGTPYSWGGGGVTGPSYGIDQGARIKGFDCSSLLQYAVYHASGGEVLLPRATQKQVTKGRHVSKGGLHPGDAIFISVHGQSMDHVGIYVGHNIMIHAPHTGARVRYEELSHFATKRWEIRRFG